eukprot:CAMPEP_0114977962 /NCGR_PEP_ID=MMETSP0216-20121206/3537_1 /TAXON_ID=223996 /ORGANISM="Protocruzia adherens, Strain Boccale" /LENGTH=330 /DNA_ID=CAMNT_0002339095 /DNA_START=14 /DNA_END=1003 /DNA_ORIENTATION=-
MASPNLAKSDFEELLQIANSFICPRHLDKEIKMFCSTDGTFGCHDCINSKPEDWICERTKTKKHAIDLVYQYFREARCDIHPAELAIHFCTREHFGKCARCVAKCFDRNHILSDLDSLYNSRMEKIIQMDSETGEFIEKKISDLQNQKEQYIEDQKVRINYEFDSYIAAIEQKREEVLNGLETKIDIFFQSQSFPRLKDIGSWNSIVHEAKRANKVELIRATSSGGSMLKTMAALHQLEESHTKFVTHQELKDKTFFLRTNLVDLSSAPLLGNFPQHHRHSPYKKISFTAPPAIPRVTTESFSFEVIKSEVPTFQLLDLDEFKNMYKALW